MKVILCVAASLLLLSAVAADPVRPGLTHRWFYVGSGLRTKQDLEHYTALLPRAAEAGYNGILLDGLDWLDHTPEYVANVRAFAEEAARYHLDIYPSVMRHTSGMVVYVDPNLAEGLPVRDALFVVHGQEATLVPEPTVAVANGGFEQDEGGLPQGWGNKRALVDRTVFHSGQASLRTEPQPAYDEGGRVNQTFAVHPFRQYHITFWVKTDSFNGRVEWLVINGTGPQRAIGTFPDSVAPTQDWTRYDLLFNSLEWDTILVTFGVWGATEGRIWWDDVAVEEVSLLNPLRREGTPITVKGEDGTLYEEGRDFEPIRDEDLHYMPRYHPPLPIRLAPDSRIKDGARLRVSYYHPIYLAGNLAACLSEEKVYEAMRQELVTINEWLHPKGFFMNDDEIRVANWDEACQKRGLTPGQMLAEKVGEVLSRRGGEPPDPGEG